MHVTIEKALPARLEDCERIFADSALYERYFAGTDRLREVLEEAVDKGELYLAVNSKGEAVGAMWIDLKGFFGAFPYLALFGVRKDCRGMGVGRLLLAGFEGVARELGHRKISLLVSHFNPRAKALYQSMGYRKVGYVENALKEGIHENIMVKDLK